MSSDPPGSLDLLVRIDELIGEVDAVLFENQSPVPGQRSRRALPVEVDEEERPTDRSDPVGGVLDHFDRWLREWLGPTPLEFLGNQPFVHGPPLVPSTPPIDHRRPTSPSPAMRASFHEAGHAAVCRHLDLEIEYLRITPFGSGRVVLRRRLAMRSPVEELHFLQRRLIVMFAGSLVEEFQFGAAIWQPDTPPSDLPVARRIIQRLLAIEGTYPSDRHLHLRELRARRWCREILSREEVWEWVEAIADAALLHEVLSGREIDALRPGRSGGA